MFKHLQGRRQGNGLRDVCLPTSDTFSIGLPTHFWESGVGMSTQRVSGCKRHIHIRREERVGCGRAVEPFKTHIVSRPNVTVCRCMSVVSHITAKTFAVQTSCWA